MDLRWDPQPAQLILTNGVPTSSIAGQLNLKLYAVWLQCFDTAVKYCMDNINNCIT